MYSITPYFFKKVGRKDIRPGRKVGRTMEESSPDILAGKADNRDIGRFEDNGNFSHGNDSEGYFFLEEYDYEKDYIKIFVFSAIALLTIVGNSCVILAIFCRNMKMSRMYYFILHLSIADLLTAFFSLIPEIIPAAFFPHHALPRGPWPVFYGGNGVCKIVKFGQMVGPYLSSYLLIMTAIDRFQVICDPLSNCSWTPAKANAMIAAAWVISLLLCVPQALVFHGDGEALTCEAFFEPEWTAKLYVTWYAISNLFVPLVVLIFCYGRICHALWDNFNERAPRERLESNAAAIPVVGEVENAENSGWKSKIRCCCRRKHSQKSIRLRWKANKTGGGGSSSGGEDEKLTGEQNGDVVVKQELNGTKSNELTVPRTRERRSSSCGDAHSTNPRSHSTRRISRAKIKTVKLTVAVIGLYIICSAPFTCVQLWSTYGTVPESVSFSMRVLFYLMTLNSAVNPWIYMIFNPNLVEALCNACCGGNCCSSGNGRGNARGGANDQQRRSSYNPETNNLVVTRTTSSGFGESRSRRVLRLQSGFGADLVDADLLPTAQTTPSEVGPRSRPSLSKTTF